MKALVTGAAGRVGRRLTTRLRDAGVDVEALVLPDDTAGQEWLTAQGVRCYVGTLGERQLLREACAGASYVVHLAAVMDWSSEADHTVFEQNVRGTLNLVEAAAGSTELRRFFLASSDEVYPSLGAAYVPIDEAHPQRPYSAYGLSKQLAESIVDYFGRARRVPVTTARFALVTEAREVLSPDGWLGRFLFARPFLGMLRATGREAAAAVLEAAGGYDPDVLVDAMDDAGQPYTFHVVDVRDLVEGIWLQLTEEAAVGETFNLSGPAPFTYSEAADLLAEATGRRVVRVRLPGVRIDVSHDITKAQRMLGYAPEIDIGRLIGTATRAGAAKE
ncbi:NAD-dependent epimerase/dehydratase family protein [Phytoactinopolyspora limicola]|uniref:NAD-dependent epimerase/dehydratase family protein n=1 Tax=Phytoactinopolyspora limicola TaxID=2715536 RepID=UPI0014085089|nr:NAD(P)-dependent oxidoreductase [Phytoactinopolyspora limicola]